MHSDGMIEETIGVGLALERHMLGGAWGGFAWRPLAVLAAAPDVAPWTPLGPAGARAAWYAGRCEIRLYSTDTASYRDNLETGEPKLWVVLRADGPEPPVDVLLVTADPAEGEAATESGANVVETAPMPPEVAGLIAQFIAAHHVERPVIKRRRDRAEPDVRWRGKPGSAGGGEGGGRS